MLKSWDGRLTKVLRLREKERRYGSVNAWRQWARYRVMSTIDSVDRHNEDQKDRRE